MIVVGFSTSFFHVFENRATDAPSTTLWSADQLTVITLTGVGICGTPKPYVIWANYQLNDMKKDSEEKMQQKTELRQMRRQSVIQSIDQK